MSEKYLDCLWSHDCSWFDFVLAPYVDLLGSSTVGMLIGGTIILSLYILADDLALPSVMTILLGGIFFTILPGGIQQVALSVMIVGGLAAFMEVARRYVL
ncbi:hypothetical protein SAMN06269185_1075 [Natronoarchaeum philippinense]|uniref:Uncharacterized protein n=1 Tax=Natronoarchaeum philippinense TaxID=558529 RepID=A0A285NE21_NATPI|nr:hypothetical protein [Natronoarchaeum philippinense]SNZ06176.1 hypothetical protein SAMN06269185_1075 [Natronoarchaeum philippinense]